MSERSLVQKKNCAGKEEHMARKFPMFVDISNKKIIVYGAGRIASRRVETLLAFAPLLTVVAPRADAFILRSANEGLLTYEQKAYEQGNIPEDTFMVLSATDNEAINESIYEECRRKGIPVNVCSNREHCDFQFPGIAMKDDLVIGINAGGQDHRLARAWTEKIRKEVEEDGYDGQTEKAADDSRS